MKGPRELRRWMGVLRSRAGRRNGVVPGRMRDIPEFERKAAKAARARKARPRVTISHES